VGLLAQRRLRGTVVVPSIVGLSQSSATRKVEALGLKVVLSYWPDDPTHPGIVHSQWPLAGRRQDAGGDAQLQGTIQP
jgi:beta-lactam-binding protein with PASTA domain